MQHRQLFAKANFHHNSLAIPPHQSDRCCDRGYSTAEGENIMTSTIEDTETAQAQAASEQPKGTKKAGVAKRAANVAPKKGKPGKKATPAKKAPKSAKKPTGARDGSKTATILEMLKRPGGATAKELLKMTGWQPHSLRGFISGTLGTKMGLTVVSAKSEDGERSYSIK
jgi:Protein of unknown function (DUF3489)